MPAFPGAEGFASYVTGGRGGEVYHVTHLGDSGPGSFRDAVSRGPRIVVFDVGGYVRLRSPVSVRSNLTIAGQTAQGAGIATRDYEVSFSGSHNIIVRYIRFRQGLTPGQDRKSAVAIYRGQDIILDHVSMEWGRWDTLDMNQSFNITIQHSIIGEGISPQRFGCLCQSDNVTFTHDLFINHHSRNPKAKGTIQFNNNVVYNWELDAFIEGGFSAAQSYANVTGNYFIKGPSTGSHGPFAGGNTNFHIYAEGNFYDPDRNSPLGGRFTTIADLGDVDVQDVPFDYPAVAIESAQDAYAAVVNGVGASLNRDSVDARLIDDLLNKTGAIISDPDSVGGFGMLEGGPAPEECAADGIPDDWKLRYGLDPCTYAADGDFDGTGYTNIEKYFNGLVDGSY